MADEVLDFHRSRSRSSASAISSSAVRSPGSILSCSATASPFSNVGSPLDPEPNYLVTGVLPSSFSNEVRIVFNYFLINYLVPLNCNWKYDNVCFAGYAPQFNFSGWN